MTEIFYCIENQSGIFNIMLQIATFILQLNLWRLENNQPFRQHTKPLPYMEKFTMRQIGRGNITHKNLLAINHGSILENSVSHTLCRISGASNNLNTRPECLKASELPIGSFSCPHISFVVPDIRKRLHWDCI